MGIGFLIEYIINSNTLSRVRALLKDLCGFHFILLDLEGSQIPLTPPQNQLPLERNSNNPKQPLLKNKTEITDLQSKLAQVSQAKRALDFVLKDNQVAIIVPIIYVEQVVGYFLTYGKETAGLKKAQINTIKAFLQETIQQVVNNDFKFLNDYKGNNTTYRKKTLHRITQFIHDNYRQTDLNLNEVSKKNNISYYYLSHLFKKELKITFSNYLSNLRLDVASRLLKDRSLTVNQVAFSCGFEDASYFSKVFKKRHGKSPTLFRDLTLPRSK